MKRISKLLIIYILLSNGQLQYASEEINGILGNWTFKETVNSVDTQISIKIFLNSESNTDITVSIALYGWMYHNCKLNQIPGIVICKEGALFRINAKRSRDLDLEFLEDQKHLIEDIYFETSSKRKKFKFLKENY